MKKGSTLAKLKITIDYETKSKAKIRTVGAHRYSTHPSTEAFCFAIKVGLHEPRIWFPEWVHKLLRQGEILGELPTAYRTILPVIESKELFELLLRADEIEAHNAEFETVIWRNVCIPKYGWPQLDTRKLRCSLAKCSYHSLPRGLGEACAALGLPHQKDEVGHRLMLKMCKPRTPTKTNPSEWHQDAADIVRLSEYCLQDVRAEHGLSEALADLPPVELRYWQLDQRINSRGIYADVPIAERMVDAIALMHQDVDAKVSNLSGGKVRTAKQVSKALAWMQSCGVKIKSLKADSVSEYLKKPGLPPAVREFLELRQEAAKASTAKYKSIIACAGEDQRIRGTLLYHGASTGRWTGRLIQPQNFPRGMFTDIEECLDLFDLGGLDLVETYYGPPLAAAATCLRGILRAAPGNDFLCADYASIEARVLAFLAGEEHVLAAFRAGKDLYKVAAMSIFGVEYEAVTKKQRQVGKVAVLALGYQGGIGAFASMAGNYAVDLESLPAFVFGSGTDEDLERSRKIAKAYLSRNSGAMSEDAATACDLIKRLWRAAHPKITTFWRGLEGAAHQAVENPGQVTAFRGIYFRSDPDDFLRLRLPSGRKLHFRGPAIKEKTASWGGEKEVVVAMGVNSTSKKWVELPYYGGLWTENVVQAFSRDLMAAGMLRLENAGYPMILSIHDELLAEVKKGQGDLEEFCRLMSQCPTWAEGCPVEAEGWRGERYRKG